jgi:hypothetical protein
VWLFLCGGGGNVELCFPPPTCNIQVLNSDSKVSKHPLPHTRSKNSGVLSIPSHFSTFICGEVTGISRDAVNQKPFGVLCANRDDKNDSPMTLLTKQAGCI